LPSCSRGLEDNDDGDDTASGNCDGCYQSELNPIAYFNIQTSYLDANCAKSGNGSISKEGREEEATATDAISFFTVAASIRSKTLATKETTIPFSEMSLQLLE
jgi:hypothetical protein